MTHQFHKMIKKVTIKQGLIVEGETVSTICFDRLNILIRLHDGNIKMHRLALTEYKV